jgi:hypothetical protein
MFLDTDLYNFINLQQRSNFLTFFLLFEVKIVLYNHVSLSFSLIILCISVILDMQVVIFRAIPSIYFLFTYNM